MNKKFWIRCGIGFISTFIAGIISLYSILFSALFGLIGFIFICDSSRKAIKYEDEHEDKWITGPGE